MNPTAQPETDQENPIGDEEEDEAFVEDQETPGMMITEPPVVIEMVEHNVISAGAGMLTSSAYPPKRVGKKKKGKGSRKLKNLPFVEEKVRKLLESLNLIPLVPSKRIDFVPHEKLLKRLGLWEFVHIDFESDQTNIRADLIAQLIVTYDPESRCSYVNASRIMVNRADLGRAVKLPLKKERGTNMVVDGVDLDCDPISDDSIAFLDDFVSSWMLLHEDEELWIMPDEVVNMTRHIREGHPEKVDWAGLLWFMIEKELIKGEQLVDCYYASHLQYLIKSQREEFFKEPSVDGLQAEIGGDALQLITREESESVDNSELEAEEEDTCGGANVELTLGQKVIEEEEVKDVEMLAGDEFNENDVDLEEKKWSFNGKDSIGEHLLQRCSVGGLNSLEDRKEEDDLDGEEAAVEAEDGFDAMPTNPGLHGNGLTGNFLQAMETTQLNFALQRQPNHESSIGLIGSHNEVQDMTTTGPSFYNDNGKREIVHEHDVSHHPLNDGNKRVRLEGPWGTQAEDLETCLEQMHLIAERARLLYTEKVQAQEQSSMNHQILLNELQKRDMIIERLTNAKRGEIEKRDGEIYRLNRELYLMASLLDDYKKALKQTDQRFSEYRQQCDLPEEPIYKDAGPGGLVLSNTDIEIRRKREEEEFLMNCAILEQQAKIAEEGYALRFGFFADKVDRLRNKLSLVENAFKLLKDCRLKVTGTSASPTNE